MRRPDGATSRIVLIGTAGYRADASLPDLPAVLNNLTDLESELSTPAHGWFSPGTCEVVRDPGTAEHLADRLNLRARQAEDLLLVYYAGHGLLDSNGNLHLGLTGTKREWGLLRYTAMPYDGVREAVVNSPARNRVVILDCCFSGRAIDVMASDDVVREQTQITGTFTLTATASGVTALAPSGERNTAFTGGLLRLLREGDPRAPEQLTLDHIYRSLYRGLKSRGLPEPRRQGTDTVEDLVLAHNRGYRPPSADSPRDGAHQDTAGAGGRLVVEDAEQLGHGGDAAAAVRRYTEITQLLLPLYGADSPNVRSAQASRDFWRQRVTWTTPPPWRLVSSTAATPVCICVDYGAGNSVVSVLQDGEPIVLVNAEGAKSTPSVVAFAKNGEVLVGEEARRQAVVNAERTVHSVKRHLGTDWKFQLDGKTFRPERIAAFTLHKLKRDAEARLRCEISEAVITVPAHFHQAQREAIRKAGELAGLNVLRIVSEPTAAALAAYGRGRNDRTVLVFDLGAGTFSVSLLEAGDGVVEVKATSGDTALGGDDWDQRIVDHLVQRFRADHGVDLSTDRMAVQRVREAAERAKIDLSSSAETFVSLPYVASSAKGTLHLEEKLTRVRFQQLTADLLKRCEAPFHTVLRDAGTGLADIDRVVLVGGSTRMPAVAELVRELTGGKETGRGTNADEVVAMGAALQAGLLKEQIEKILILDVTPFSLGVETKGGVMTRLIERNTTIPTKRSEIFTTAEDGQPSLQIRLYQGEHELVAHNTLLGTFELCDLPPAPRGVPQIEVTFHVDADNLIRMSAKDLGTGQEQRIVSSP